jgi:superfamily II DNA or RNA helicase
MDIKTLRPYQNEHFPVIFQALAKREHVLLSYCVSGGKTCMAMALGSHVMRTNTFSHVIILTPSNIIEKQFKTFSKTVSHIHAAERNIVVAGIAPDRGKQALAAYCQSDNTESDIFVTNYVNFDWDALEKILAPKIKDVLMIIDEAHHASIDPRNLVSFRSNEFREAGGTTFKLTGTPYRTDQAQVANDGDLCIRRSLLEHMLEGFAPANIYSEIVTIEGGGLDDSDDESSMGTYGIPLNEEAGFRKMVEHIIQDGRPKCIVRLKPGSIEQNPKRVEVLTRMLEAQGLTVVNATGKGTEAFHAMCELENGEQSLRYSETPDVVIAFGRMNEGVNLPSRSHVYLYGVPRSMQLVEQILGRIMRLRLGGDGQLIVGYPEAWQNASKITLFLGEVENASDKHTNFLLQLISYLSAFQFIEMFAHVTRIKDGINSSMRERTVRSITEMLESIKSDTGSQAMTCLKQALSLFEEFKTPWTSRLTKNGLLQMGLSVAQKQNLDLSKEDLSRFLILKQAMGNSKLQETIKFSISMMEITDGYHLQLDQALDSVYDQFQDECLVSDNMYLIEGENAAWIVERLKDELSTGPAPTSPEEVWKGIEAFRASHGGRYPKLLDRDPLRNRSFRSYHLLLKRQAWGTDLFQFIIDRESQGKHWAHRLNVVVVAIEKTTNYRNAEEAMNSSTKSELVKQFSLEMPEMFYYPRAWEALRDFEWACELTLEQAHYLGQRSKNIIEELMEREGMDEVLAKIVEKSLP